MASAPPPWRQTLAALVCALALTGCVGAGSNYGPAATEQRARLAPQSLIPFSPALPYGERWLLGSAQASAFAVELVAGQQLQLLLKPAPGAVLDLEAHLYAASVVDGRADAKAPAYVAALERGQSSLLHRVDSGGRYLLVVAPGPRAAGTVDVELSTPPPYGFPVATDSPTAVQSFFGAPRDGGRRRHEGIDIFAPRGTPVIAAAEGRVTRVVTTGLGGLQVWVRADGRHFYYAHLDTALVTPGARVERGQALGTVGNSGNARTTPPHLHFGIYQRGRGASDPLPLVGGRLQPPQPAPQAQPPAPAWLEVAAATLNVRGAPDAGAPVVATLSRGELVPVSASQDTWLRLRGAAPGFVAREYLRAPTATSRPPLANATPLYLEPAATSPVLAELPAATALTRLGIAGDYEWVATAEGLRGWLARTDSAASATDTL